MSICVHELEKCEKSEQLFLKKHLDVPYIISYTDPEKFYNIDEIIDYWVYDVSVCDAKYNTREYINDNDFITNFKTKFNSLRNENLHKLKLIH